MVATGKTRSASVVLQWLRGQAKASKSEARALGYTQRALAAALGISDRALRHYMAPPGSSDHREIPDKLARKLERVLDEKLDSLRVRREVQDDVEGLARFRPDRLPLPFKQTRYKRPKYSGEPSEIFFVDITGMSLDDLPGILRYYWHTLKATGKHWDVRVQARVRVADYFKGGVDDREIKRSVRGRKEMSIWIPNRLRGLFVHPQMTKSPGDSIPDFIDSLRVYGDRILPDGLQKIAFIPFKPESRIKRRKRRK